VLATLQFTFDNGKALLSRLSVWGATSVFFCVVGIGGSSHVEMEGVSIVECVRGPSTAAVAFGTTIKGGGQLTACRSDFHSSQGTGLCVENGGVAVLECARCDGNGNCGNWVYDKGTVVAHCSSASGNGECNVMVTGGKAELFESRLEACSQTAQPCLQ